MHPLKSLSTDDDWCFFCSSASFFHQTTYPPSKRKAPKAKKTRERRPFCVPWFSVLFSLLSFVLFSLVLFVCLFVWCVISLIRRSFPPPFVWFSLKRNRTKKKKLKIQVMHFFSSFSSVFFNETSCCVFGVSFIHPFPKRSSLLFNTQHTHTPHTYIYI